MSKMTKVHIDRLTGPALIWALDSIEPGAARGIGQMKLLLDDEADHGRSEALRIKLNVWVEPGHDYPWLSCVSGKPLDRRIGDTRSEAIFRAVVAHRLGETVGVPRGLLP